MDSRPINPVSYFSPNYMPYGRDADEEKREKTETKRDHKAEPEDRKSETSLPDGLGSQIDTVV